MKPMINYKHNNSFIFKISMIKGDMFMTKEQEELYNYIMKNNDFNLGQLNQIECGLETGLTKKTNNVICKS